MAARPGESFAQTTDVLPEPGPATARGFGVSRRFDDVPALHIPQRGEETVVLRPLRIRQPQRGMPAPVNPQRADPLIQLRSRQRDAIRRGREEHAVDRSREH